MAPSDLKKVKKPKKAVFKKPTRTFCNGIFLGYKRSKSVQRMNQALIQIEGLTTRQDSMFYMGKQVAYPVKGGQNRKMIGKVIRPHGNSGVVRAKFKKNLPPMAIGKRVRVKLYPSNI